MTFAIVSLLATLALILALNWRRLNTLGSAKVAQMLGIWTAIILGLVLILKYLGY
ncbi:hypothetical protein [Sandaracinobacter sp.]|jgi:hypothetical protein|uniref:hypothetical protein n=1 Tax=Sandaracinobacter sp. TaxID=2487581 RepID=UPI0035AF81D6